MLRIDLRRYVLAWVIVAASIATLCGGSRAHADEAGTTPEQEAEWFRWWDGLGFPDLSKARFVKAATGNWIQHGNQPKTPIYEYGFVLADEDSTFVLFSTDLVEKRWKRTPAKTPEWDRIGHEPADFLAFVREGVATMRKHGKAVEWHEDEALDPFRAHRWLVPNQAFRLMVMARVAEARGAADLAHDLAGLALREMDSYREDAKKTTAERLLSLRRDVVSEARAAEVDRIAEEDVPLAGIRDRFRRLAKMTPADPRNAEDAAILERMVAEGDSPKRLVGQSDKAARLEDLVFSLRKRTGFQWAGGYGHASKEGVAPVPPGEAASIALEAMGFDAVPRLLAELEDKTFTRSVLRFETGHGQFREGVLPYRLRDAAADILDAIAAGAFRDEYGSAFSLHPRQEEEWGKLVERAKAWWELAREKGTEGMLVSVVSSGGRAAIAPAQRLALAFPKSAIAAIRDGIGKTTETWAASQLLAALAAVASHEATEVFLEVLRDDERHRMRLVAAEALLRRGRHEGVLAMAREWTHPTPREKGPKPFLPADPGIDGDMLSFLASSGDVAAYRALAKDLEQRPIGARFAVVSPFLRERGDRSAFGIGPSLMPAAGDASVPARLSPEARAALEDLLGARLGDESEVENVWMSVGGVEVDQRLGHVAARALAAQFPERYRYDPKASGMVREAQRLAAQNQWRAAHSLPPLAPAPERARPSRVADSIVGPVVERLVASKEGTERDAREEELLALGLGALPAVVERLEALDESSPAHVNLASVAARLSSTVTEVVVPKDSLAPDAPYADLLANLRNKPFGGDAFVRLVVGALKTPPNGAVGVRIRATRFDDLSGVLLVVTLLKDPIHGWGGQEPGWSQMSTTGPNLRVGSRSGGGRGGAMANDYAKEAEAWKEEAAEVESAFREAPRTPVTLGFSIVREE